MFFLLGYLFIKYTCRGLLWPQDTLFIPVISNSEGIQWQTLCQGPRAQNWTRQGIQPWEASIWWCENLTFIWGLAGLHLSRGSEGMRIVIFRQNKISAQLVSVFHFSRRKITWKGTTPLANDLSLFISGFGWKAKGELILTGKDYRTFQGRRNLLSNGLSSFQNLTGVNTLSPSSCTWCHLWYNTEWPPWGGLHLGAAILARWVVVWRGSLYVYRPAQRNGSVNLILIIIYVVSD